MTLRYQNQNVVLFSSFYNQWRERSPSRVDSKFLHWSLGFNLPLESYLLSRGEASWLWLQTAGSFQSLWITAFIFFVLFSSYPSAVHLHCNFLLKLSCSWQMWWFCAALTYIFIDFQACLKKSVFQDLAQSRQITFKSLDMECWKMGADLTFCISAVMYTFLRKVLTHWKNLHLKGI